MYLSFGVTALLFQAVNEGLTLGRRARLARPVQAMREISLDPWVRTKVHLADGRRLNAVEIQRLYFDEVEPLVRKGDLAEWGGELLAHWAATLDHLERDPRQLARRLDCYLKLTIFQHELSRAGYDWVQLRRALEILESWRHRVPESVIRAMLAEAVDSLPAEERSQADQLTRDRGFRKLGLELIRFAVRLQAVELNYHELGGLFDQIDAGGHVESVVLQPEDVAHAVYHAPPGGRAEARGRCITALSGQRSWRCDWEAVICGASQQWYDLQNPFADSFPDAPSPHTDQGGAERQRFMERFLRRHR